MYTATFDGVVSVWSKSAQLLGNVRERPSERGERERESEKARTTQIPFFSFFFLSTNNQQQQFVLFIFMTLEDNFVFPVNAHLSSTTQIHILFLFSFLFCLLQSSSEFSTCSAGFASFSSVLSRPVKKNNPINREKGRREPTEERPHPTTTTQKSSSTTRQKQRSRRSFFVL